MMYSWKSLRTAATFLICLPLLHAGLLLSREFSSYIDPSPTVWNSNLQQIVTQDQAMSLPESPILISGGQRVHLWQNLAPTLQPRNVLLRPLGDATLEDLAYHYDRIIGFYRPETLILVPSYADLHLRSNKTADQFAAALENLLTIDSDYGTTRHRYVLVPIKTMLHPDDHVRIDRIATKLERIASTQEHVSIIDPNPLLSGDAGGPDPDFYRGDGVNLNDAGYARLTALLRTRLERDGLISIKG